MSGNGASPDEMAFLRNPAADPELAGLSEALRTNLLAPPDRATAAALVPRLAGQARISAAQAPGAGMSSAPRGRSRRRLAAKVALGVASVPLLTAGIAFAGVKLPGPAQSAFEGVGLELPNQGDRSTGAGSGENGAGAPTTAEPQGPAPGAEKAPAGSGAGKARPGRSKPSTGSRSLDNGEGISQGQGKSGAAPGQNKPDRGPAQGKAVGKNGSTPPGKAKKPASSGKASKPASSGKARKPAKPPKPQSAVGGKSKGAAKKE